METYIAMDDSGSQPGVEEPRQVTHPEEKTSKKEFHLKLGIVPTAMELRIRRLGWAKE